MRFEDYVTEQGNSLLRLAYVLTSDGQLAEDLTQTVLADAYRHWRRVATARHPDAYVRRMLVNAHLSWHRRRSSTERRSDLTALEPGIEGDPADGVASRDQIRQLMATLAPRARTVLALRYYADLDDAAMRWASARALSERPPRGLWRPYAMAASWTP